MADTIQSGFIRSAAADGSLGPLIVQGPAGSGAAGTGQGTSGIVTTATPARVSASATAVTLKAANTARKSLSIYNEPTAAVLYVKRGSAATITDYEIQVAPGGYYELPFPMYQGIVTGIWASAAGAAMVTEGV